MKFKFCGIRINVTKYDVTFATKREVLTPRSYATGYCRYGLMNIDRTQYISL